MEEAGLATSRSLVSPELLGSARRPLWAPARAHKGPPSVIYCLKSEDLGTMAGWAEAAQEGSPPSPF